MIAIKKAQNGNLDPQAKPNAVIIAQNRCQGCLLILRIVLKPNYNNMSLPLLIYKTGLTNFKLGSITIPENKIKHTLNKIIMNS